MTHKFCLILICLIISPVLFSQPYNSAYKKQTISFTGNITIDSNPVLADSNSNMIVDFFTEKPKHPFKAVLMSVIIPGTGELYSESYKSAIGFFSAEVILLSTYIYFNNLADERESNFHKIADDPVNGWFVDKYASYLIEKAGSGNLKAAKLRDAMANDYKQYSTDPNFNTYSQSGQRSWWSLLNQLERDLTYENGNTFSHNLPYYGSQQYYELIGKYSQFSGGWYDFSGNPGIDASPSAAFLSYRDARTKANDTHDLANNILIAVFLNHAASAVNAALQAKWYNQDVHVSFMNRKVSNENWYATNISFNF